MDFSSDTSAPAHPAVLDAMQRANSGMEGSYGGDSVTAHLRELVSDLFETRVAVLPVGSGTAANALALSMLCGPTEAVACHREAHIERDERGAPEFYTQGGKLHLLDGEHGRIDEADFKSVCSRINRSFVHETPIAALSITNLTECGSAYDVAQVRELSAIAKAAGLKVHMDGARLGNALVGTNMAPADMTWRAGIDVLSFGLTKTGGAGCELICLFGDMADRYDELLARAKRGGHLPPKMRFMSAQAVALLETGLWLDLARHANDMAAKLVGAFLAVEGVRLAHPVDGNEAFIYLPDALSDYLTGEGLKAYRWLDGSTRFVTSWASSEDEIRNVRQALDRFSAV